MSRLTDRHSGKFQAAIARHAECDLPKIVTFLFALNSTLWRSTYYRSAFVLYFLFQVTCTFICFKFIHSGDLYSASSRDYYSEALPAQSRTKNKDVVYIVLFVELKLMFYINFKLCFGRKSFQSESLFTWICQFCSERKV